RVVLEQVRQRVRARQVIDRDKIDVLVAERRPHDVATDTAEAVNADPNRHAKSSRTNVSFYNKPTAMYLAYSLLTLAVFIVVSPYFLYQAVRYQKYIGTLRQRLGFLPITFNIDAEESIWIHAVSVGEALTARALAADLKARYPRLRLFLSTTTIAGQQVARRSLPDGGAVFYFP